MIPERVKDKIDTLPSGQFGRRNKVLITRYQDNLVHLFFQGYGGDIHSNFHVDAFLPHFIKYVRIANVIKCYLAFQQCLDL